ncbi:glutathione transferase [Caenorhabditis elegans]|uniref:glutathione transferase n=1 Tax=Caenorhabditis elegans TaxID=6239 RepID=Q93698_CAEEL|nr:Glutathione S-Transferase [Caenorhabditis elegans]CAB02291.1 Glutathione S-Transferase [Caenorhabditis elegans]|eukprot:NP_496863.1 Glutathione S-Transferase [Caenorhabditis elegans]
MPSYKLTYFFFRGLGEPIRLLFHLAGVQFEEVRMNPDQTWLDIKDSTPMKQLPVLNIDGFELPQSGAILRYLARKFGFAGKTPEEEAWVDAVHDLFKDFLAEFKKFAAERRSGKSAEEVEKFRSEFFLPARNTYFNILNGLLEKSNSGFLIGSDITFADLVVVDNLLTLKNYGLFDESEFTKLAALREKVNSYPGIKEYIAKRPVTEY